NSSAGALPRHGGGDRTAVKSRLGSHRTESGGYALAVSPVFGVGRTKKGTVRPLDTPPQRVTGRLRRSANRQAGGPGVVARNWRDVLEGLHLPADLLSGFQPVGLPCRSGSLLAAQLEHGGQFVELGLQLLKALTRRLHCTPPLRPLMQCATGNSSSPPATSFCGYGALDPRCCAPEE